MLDSLSKSENASDDSSDSDRSLQSTFDFFPCSWVLRDEPRLFEDAGDISDIVSCWLLLLFVGLLFVGLLLVVVLAAVRQR